MSGKELYVICIGFDKHHGMACEYADFRLGLHGCKGTE